MYGLEMTHNFHTLSHENITLRIGYHNDH